MKRKEKMDLFIIRRTDKIKQKSPIMYYCVMGLHMLFIPFPAPDKGKNEGKIRAQRHKKERFKYENNFCGRGYRWRKNNYCQ